MELDPVDALAVGESRDRRVAAGGEGVEAGRHLGHGVAVAHPHRQLAAQSFEQRGRLSNREQRGAVLVRPPRVDLAAEVMRDELHAVADAQHRDPCAERLGVDLRRSGFVDAGGAATEDEPRGFALLQLRPRSRPGHELAVHLGFANPARDQLAELRSEVEDQYCLLAHRRGGFLARPGSRGGPAQLSPSPCPRAGLAGATCPPM